MPSCPRPLSNNVAACIGDIIALALDIRPRLESAGRVAERTYQDVGLLADLVAVERTINAIERHARNAQRNIYESRRLP